MQEHEQVTNINKFTRFNAKIQPHQQRQKKEEIWLTMTKAHKSNEKLTSNVKMQKRHLKTSITHQLRTDLGWSVGVATTSQIVWSNRFLESQPFHKPQKLWNRKDTHLKISKKSSL